MGFEKEKLDPQISQSTLTALTLNNYKVAQTYYSQRKKMFNSLLEKNRENVLNFENKINENINDLWNKNIYNIMNGIYWGNKTSPEKRVESVQKYFDTSPYLGDLLDAVKQNNPTVFYSKLGFIFENFLNDQAIKPFIDGASTIAGKIADSLLSSFVAGAETSLATAVSGSRNIRPDILVHLSSISFQKDAGILKASSSGLPVELQGKLSLDWSKAIPTAQEISENSIMLQKFLSEGTDFFGFSAKLWKDSQGKAFMNSSVMAKMLNEVFHKKDSNGVRHGWERDYTNEYVAYFLSHNIFDIIGPTNIAMLTGGGVIWMDEFLASRIFYMRIQIERRLRGNRIFPGITDPSIYIRNYNNASQILRMKSSKIKSGNYIDLKFQMSSK